MTLQKRLDGVEAALEERVEERLEAEITAMLEVLERNLTREEFVKVARILAHADGQ
jgi:hypothetical protein